MARLEDLTRGAAVKGILPDGLVTVVDVKWHGSAVAELTYKDASGRLGSELLYRDREPTIESLRRDVHGVLTETAPSSDSSRRPTASAWRISSIPCWPSTPRSSSHSPTRSPPSMARC